MPRDPKPWFRKDRDAWFVTINGRRFNFGSERDTATTRFHELMLNGGDERPNGSITLFSLFDEFFEWTKSQRAEATYGWYLDRIQAFVKYLKTDRFVPRPNNQTNVPMSQVNLAEYRRPRSDSVQ